MDVLLEYWPELTIAALLLTGAIVLYLDVSRRSRHRAKRRFKFDDRFRWLGT